MNTPKVRPLWLIAVSQLLIALGLLRCGRDPTSARVKAVPLGSVTSLLEADARRFSNWSQPVNLGPPVNGTGSGELDPFISKDGLSLYFACLNCPEGIPGGFDIFVSERPDVDAPWGPPRSLGPTINTAANESNPALSPDGHRLYFTSTRPGGFGLTDLYVSRRRDKRDNLAWAPPLNLGSAVNSSANDRMSAAPFEDERNENEMLYFVSDRAGGLGGDDIYVSTLDPNGTFGSASLVTELSSPFADRFPEIRRRDGLEMFLGSDRPGTQGDVDLWVSTRASTSDVWSTPVNLGSVVNTARVDGSPALSFDGTTLYFQSNRAGGLGPCAAPAGPCVFDLWATTRYRLHRPE